MTIQDYIDKINTRFKTGISREHSYRGDLQNLLEYIAPDVLVTNEPARIACGAPDYIITRKNIPIGYIEAKDIGAELNSKSHKEQFDRYRLSLNNLIITDYLTFQLFCDGVLVNTISIGQIQGNKIIGLADNYTNFISFIKDFCNYSGQTIKSSKKLAEMMAAKARLLSDIIEKALNSDEENQENSTLNEQLTAFKNILIHDIKPKEFADVYAQTIAYGMFAARLHDPTLESFSRQEAAELIPKSNPFLRKLFGYIAGPDIDDRIKWVVDSLVEVFLACNVKDLLKDYGKATKMEDPIIHFYETFLSEYDPKLRKARGVWYTPQPVVNFIVRAVDDILKTEFDLPQGLADNSKTKINVNLQITDKRYTDNVRTVEQDIHRVQILDPATGTGTFLAEVVKHIHKKFEGQQGIWSNYVETHLLPRLNGFELLMASYAMAHLKLDLLLTDTGYKPTKDQRFRVYLTNSLEEHHPDTGTLFANWLSTEANEANYIKRDTPVMVVMGNPPYSISTTNKSKWIENLISDYKKNLNERKINLDDDYIKFIRFGQHFIDKNGEGILAYISNNSFIDGITHRQMRKHLLESFDKIYILDLHGNSRKKEVCSDGTPDQNVFDIMQGVSINIFIKTGKKKKNELGEVFHCDLQGKREFKYDNLNTNNLKSVPWVNLKYTKPNYFFVPKNFDDIKVYEEGFKINELFINSNSGVETGKDDFIIKYLESDIDNLLNEIKNTEKEVLLKKYNINFDKLNQVYSDVNNAYFSKISYRPFDIRNTLISENSEGVLWRPRFSTMKHFLKDNIGLISKRGFDEINSAPCFMTKYISDRRGWSRPGMQGAESIFPLYIYKDNKPKTINSSVKEHTFFSGYKEYDEEDNLSVVEEAKFAYESLPYRPNLSQTIVRGIEKSLGILFEIQCYKSNEKFGEVDLLDYIYAVLHSPTYREKYKEFLKIDFPRVPYPKDKEIFWQLVKLGGELRQIHLLESPIIDKYVTQYTIDGDNVVGKLRYDTTKQSDGFGDVYINETQYFANVPEVAWNFYIGGYQPAQKWLKDRKDRKLLYEDINHYQRIIVALTETDRIMKEINKIEIEFSLVKKEQYNYFHIENLNKEFNEDFNYDSFLSEVESKYYPDAFYYMDLDTLLIRTKDDWNKVQSHVEEARAEFCKQKNIPLNKYLMQDATKMSFKHTETGYMISAEEFYLDSARKYLLETGIDLLHRE